MILYICMDEHFQVNRLLFSLLYLKWKMLSGFVETLVILSVLIVNHIECLFHDKIIPISVKSDFLKVFGPRPDILMVDQGPC